MGTIKEWLKVLAIFVYVFLSIVCSAGAVNYGVTSANGWYIVSGVLCFAASLWVAYKFYKEGGNG